MTTKTPKYENNPFYVGLNGISLFFNNAQTVAFLLVGYSILSTFSNTSRNDTDSSSKIPSWPLEQWLFVGGVLLVILVALIFITAMISGMSAYASAQVLKSKKVGIRESFNAVLEKFFSFIWLQIIIAVKVFLWTLLLIIPGIIMFYRYSLANIAFFDQGLKGNDAIKESLKLTKGALLTTAASQILFNIITFGMLSELVSAGARTILYRQFRASGDEEKPDAHSLSWLTVLLPLALLIAAISFIGVGIVALRATS